MFILKSRILYRDPKIFSDFSLSKAAERGSPSGVFTVSGC